MASVGLFFGSDTGNTEHVAKMIQKELGKQLIDVKDIAKSSKEDIAEFDLLIFGIPTWYYGEAQCDWDDFFPELEQIDFTDKLVAIFGCGDQHGITGPDIDIFGIRPNVDVAGSGGRIHITRVDVDDVVTGQDIQFVITGVDGHLAVTG